MTVYDFAVTSIDYKKEPTSDRPNRITFSEATTGNEQEEYKNDKGALDRHNKTYEDAAVFMTNIKEIGRGVFEADSLSIKDGKKAFEEKYKKDKPNLVVTPLFSIHGFNNLAGTVLKKSKEKQVELDSRRKDSNDKRIVIIPVIWPNEGNAAYYKHDRDHNVKVSSDEFRRLIGTTVAVANEFQNKSLLAHSMGNQVMRELASSNVKFDNIFLAAPDVRFDIFEKQYIERDSNNDFAIRIYRMLEQNGVFKGKLYVLYNSGDYALNLSDSVAVNGIYRLGQYGIEKSKLPSSISGDHIENFNAGGKLSYSNSWAHSYQFDGFALDLYWQKM